MRVSWAMLLVTVLVDMLESKKVYCSIEDLSLSLSSSLNVPRETDPAFKHDLN